MATFGIAFIVLVVVLCVALAYSLRVPPDPRDPQKGQSMNLFQRNAKGLNLTPPERAFLKLLKGLGLAALAGAATAVAQVLATSGKGPIDWRYVAGIAGVAAGVAVCNALSKYFTAQKDAPLADASTWLAGYIGKLNPVPSYGPASAAPAAPAPAAPAPSVP